MLYIALQMDIHVFLMTYDLWKELHADQERCIFRNLQSTNAVKQWRNIWLIGHTRGSQPMTPVSTSLFMTESTVLQNIFN